MLDVDGTIAESEDAHREAFNAAFKEFGVAWHWDQAIYRDLLGVSGGRERIRHYIDRTHPEMASRPDLYSFIEAMHQAKSQAYAELVADKAVGVRPGVIRLLSEVRECGLRLALVTSTTEENLHVLFDKALGNDVLSWFEVIAGPCKSSVYLLRPVWLSRIRPRDCRLVLPPGWPPSSLSASIPKARISPVPRP